MPIRTLEFDASTILLIKATIGNFHQKYLTGKKLAIAFGALLVLLIVSSLISYNGVGTTIAVSRHTESMNQLHDLFYSKTIDHYKWLNKVDRVLLDGKSTRLGVQTDDHRCKLGSWLYGEGRREAERAVPGLAQQAPRPAARPLGGYAPAGLLRRRTVGPDRGRRRPAHGPVRRDAAAAARRRARHLRRRVRPDGRRRIPARDARRGRRQALRRLVPRILRRAGTGELTVEPGGEATREQHAVRTDTIGRLGRPRGRAGIPRGRAHRRTSRFRQY